MIVRTEDVTLQTKSGPMRTHVHRPVADGTRAGIVLFSEIYQETAPIARIAAMIAGHGYVVAVPEIFHELEPAGAILPYDANGTAAGNRHKTEKSIEQFDDDARVVIDWLCAREDARGAIGAYGVCIGGHLAFRCAFDPRVRAS